MIRMILLIATFGCVLLTGCRSESEEIPVQTASKIIIKAANADLTTINTPTDPAIFTGNDILWFNETTKELRFQDNISIKPAAFNLPGINFYIDEEYLFSSMTYVNSSSSQTFNSLVLYYDILGNKYYLTDGYPEVSVLSDPQKAQEQRNENMQKITAEWNIFIEQLKKEDKYK